MEVGVIGYGVVHSGINVLGGYKVQNPHYMGKLGELGHTGKVADVGVW